MSLKMDFYSYSKILLVLFFLSLININAKPLTNSPIRLNPTIYQRFTSDLPQNTSLLNIHCKSKNDDLGIQTLKPGDLYHFKFHMNFWGTTLFYCYFSWGSKHNIFDVFKQRGGICSDHGELLKDYYCNWMMRDSGIFLAYGPSPTHDEYQFVRPWLS